MNYSLYNDDQFSELLCDRSRIYMQEIGDQVENIPESYIHYQAYDDIRCQAIEYNPLINTFVDELMYMFVGDVLSLYSLMKNYRVKYLLVRDVPLSDIQRMISERGRWLDHLHIQRGESDISELTLPQLTHFSIIGHQVRLNIDRSLESLKYLNIDSNIQLSDNRFSRLKYLRSPEQFQYLPRSLEYLNINSISDPSKIPHVHTVKLNRASIREIKNLPPSLIHLEVSNLICNPDRMYSILNLKNLITLDIHLSQCNRIELRDVDKLVYLGLTSHDNDSIVEYVDWNRLENLRRLIVKFDPRIPQILRDRPDVQILFYNMSVEDIKEHRELLRDNNIECYIEDFDQDPTPLFCGDEKFMFSIRDSLIRYYIRDIERLCS